MGLGMGWGRVGWGWDGRGMGMGREGDGPILRTALQRSPLQGSLGECGGGHCGWGQSREESGMDVPGGTSRTGLRSRSWGRPSPLCSGPRREQLRFRPPSGAAGLCPAPAVLSAAPAPPQHGPAPLQPRPIPQPHARKLQPCFMLAALRSMIAACAPSLKLNVSNLQPCTQSPLELCLQPHVLCLQPHAPGLQPLFVVFLHASSAFTACGLCSVPPMGLPQVAAVPQRPSRDPQPHRRSEHSWLWTQLGGAPNAVGKSITSTHPHKWRSPSTWTTPGCCWQKGGLGHGSRAPPEGTAEHWVTPQSPSSAPRRSPSREKNTLIRNK